MINEVASSLSPLPIRLNGAEFYPPGVQVQPHLAARPSRHVEAELLPNTMPRTMEFVSQQYAEGQLSIIDPDYELLRATALYRAIEEYGLLAPQMDIFA